jgi:hypothetical protein
LAKPCRIVPSATSPSVGYLNIHPIQYPKAF